MQDNVEVPRVPRVTLEGLRLHERPVDGERDDPRAIDPLNPPRLVMVILTGEAVPPVNVTVAGLATIEKSCIV